MKNIAAQIATFEFIPSHIIKGKTQKIKMLKDQNLKKLKKERSVFINKKADTK